MTKSKTKPKLTFIPITDKRGFYADMSFKPERLNLSGALALFTPTYEGMELLKQDLIGNVKDVIERAKGQVKDPNSWVQTELMKLIVETGTEGYRRSIKRIVQRQQHLLQPTKVNHGVTEAQIEQAKEHPLEDLIDKRMFKATGKWRANCHCPLSGHEGEKTPSFYIDRNNHYKCFGCQGKGDAIAFVMQRDGVDFVRAVKSLIQ